MKPLFYCNKLISACFLVIVFCTTESKGQSYGLGFYSHEFVADQRTSLDLFPGKGFLVSKNFKLSFEMAFLQDKIDYFGYVFRIIENGNRNIDLIYNKRNLVPDSSTEDHNHFKIIMGDHFSKIGFNILQKQLLHQWTKITMDFDFDHDQLILYVNQNKYIETNAHLNKNSYYKLLFGVNNYPNFKTNDAPSFKLRNITIDVAGKPQFSWPLNEADGHVVHDTLSNQQGEVSHPLWIRALHKNWHLLKTVKAQGMASVAFNPLTAEVYVVGNDSLWSLSVKTGKQIATAYANGKYNLLPSNESVFNIYDRKLYNYYIDRKNGTVATYNFTTQTWDNKGSYFPIIDFWHSNNFFSTTDTSLYVVDGYGQLTYKNKVQRYHIPTRQWQEITVKGDNFCPRYLAACGTTDSGRYAYFLGGYGSPSGQQMLNPKNMYDLIKYDVKAKSFKKIYNLKIPDEDFAFANSMIIDEKTQTFNALAFSNHKYNAYLQLFAGSLQHPSYQLIGSKIPFNFYDTHSFANLFYSPLSQQLVAVTISRSETNLCIVNIFTLSNPPDSQTLSFSTTVGSSNFKYYLIAILICAATIACFIYFRQKRINHDRAYPNKISHSEPALLITPSHETSIDTPDHSYKQRTILLFGDLKLYTLTGDDITGHFTSLIRELFLAIIIYSLKSGRGISPEKLIELLWFDKSETSARNNRSANLSKLKSLLSQLEYIQLSKVTGNWKIEIDFNHIYVDYHSYLQIIANKKSIDKERIISLIEITQRGAFLPSADYPWLDQIKSEISNEIIDIYLQYASLITLEDDPEILIKLANCIFNFDSVNEEAMIIKCKALSFLGKHSLAKSTFQAFNKEYVALYGEEFKKDFHTILE